MTTKVKSVRLDPLLDMQFALDSGPKAPITPEERREQVQALGVRINNSISSMCQLQKLTGVSTEAKDRAFVLFHQRLAVVEKELGRIWENLTLE